MYINIYIYVFIYTKQRNKHNLPIYISWLPEGLESCLGGQIVGEEEEEGGFVSTVKKFT